MTVMKTNASGTIPRTQPLAVFGASSLYYAWFLRRHDATILGWASFANSTLLDALRVTLVFAAGAFLTYLTLRLVSAPAAASSGQPSSLVLRSIVSGILGMAAPTFVACVAVVLFQTYRVLSSAPHSSERIALPLALMSASAYEMGSLVAAVTNGVIYGLVAAAYVRFGARKSEYAERTPANPVKTAQLALLLTALGLVLFLIPFIGIALSVWGFVLGILAYRAISREGAQNRNRAVASIVLGSLGIALQILAIGVFTATRIGWIHHDTVPQHKVDRKG
jgi:hypothetical protein